MKKLVSVLGLTVLLSVFAGVVAADELYDSPQGKSAKVSYPILSYSQIMALDSRVRLLTVGKFDVMPGGAWDTTDYTHGVGDRVEDGELKLIKSNDKDYRDVGPDNRDVYLRVLKGKSFHVSPSAGDVVTVGARTGYFATCAEVDMDTVHMVYSGSCRNYSVSYSANGVGVVKLAKVPKGGYTLDISTNALPDDGKTIFVARTHDAVKKAPGTFFIEKNPAVDTVAYPDLSVYPAVVLVQKDNPGLMYIKLADEAGLVNLVPFYGKGFTMIPTNLVINGMTGKTVLVEPGKMLNLL